MMNIDSLGSYTQNNSNFDWSEHKEINLMPLIMEWHKELAKANSSFSNTYTITAAKKILEEGMMEFIYPQPSNTPFSTALSQKQSAVSEYEYNLAASRIEELMKEISAFALIEQGENSELSFYLNSLSVHYSITLAYKQETLQSIKEQVADYNSDKESLINSIHSYFVLYTPPYEKAIAFFDYISDKIEGLPMDQIMQDLAILKGYWDNNSRENLTLDNGIKVGFVYADEKGNSKAILTISLPNGIKAEFNEINLYDENSKILFEMFQQRENFDEVNANKNSSTFFSLNDLSKLKFNLQTYSHTTQSNSPSHHLLRNLLNDLD